MKIIRLLVNWMVVLLSPVWSVPFLLYKIFQERSYPSTKLVFKEGKDWIWE